MDPQKEKRLREEAGLERWQCEKDMAQCWCLKDEEMGVWVKEYRWPLEAWKGMETDSPLETPERNTDLPTPLF